MTTLASPGASAYRLMSATGAVCKINGEVVPCDQLWEGFKWFAGLGLGAMAVLFIIGILAFIFWLMMLIHAIKQPIEHKPLWIIILLFFGFIGAVVYYFAVKRSTPSLAVAQTVVTPSTPPGPARM